VGAEVEYPLYESQRLFEVSKSPKFNPNEFPVYQFTNNAAPELATSMVYGLVNLEPGQTYNIRSRLSSAGDPRDGCAVTPDPEFCESLKAKKKWTIPYEFDTENVAIVSNVTPLEGQEIPAWASPFSWTVVKGAAGYGINIADNDVTMASHIVPIESFYDEDQSGAIVNAALALSKEKKYTHSLAPYQKLGSEWAVHVLPNGMLQSFTDAEKDAMPIIYGPWTEPALFTTDIPKVVPGDSPADKKHMPLIGDAFNLTGSRVVGADHYQFEYKEPYHKASDLDSAFFGFLISNVPGITDQQEIKWAFTPVKKAIAPFITEDEAGEPEWRSFIADLGMSKSPDQEGISCTPAGGPITFKWEAVQGAMDYKLVVLNRDNGQEVALGKTSSDHLTIDNVNEYPNPAHYTWKVKAGIKNTNGEWLYGPESSQDYDVGPPAPTNLVPTAADSPYGGTDLNQGGLTLNWQSQYAPDGYWLKLRRGNEDWVVDQKVLANSVLIKGLKFDSNYHWAVKAIGDGGEFCDWAEADFETYGLGQNAVSDIKVIEKGQEGNDGSGEGNNGGGEGNGNGDPDEPEKACPGTFTVSMINSGQIEISLLTNKLGTSEVLEGTSDIYTNEYYPLLGNGAVVYPGGVYNENDEVVLYIKVKAINGEWAELPFDEIPEVTFTTSSGQVMTHKFSFNDWYLDKEIMMGSYHCANE
jgi:hypothetical protein